MYHSILFPASVVTVTQLASFFHLLIRAIGWVSREDLFEKKQSYAYYPIFPSAAVCK